MPAPPLSFHENEAAMAWGYTLAAWQEESVMNRAKAVSHCIHKNLREAYSSEVAMDKAKGSKAPGHDYRSLMQSMGL